MKMFFTILTLTLIGISSSRSQEECLPESGVDSWLNTQCLYSRPLVIGASVSDGYKAGGVSTPMMVARHFNPQAVISNHAQSGETGNKVIAQIPEGKYSVVLGLDLFFWDNAKGLCDKSFEISVKNFFKRFQDQNIPMIIGTLPTELKLTGVRRILRSSSCMTKITKLLHDQCLPEKYCELYDPNKCLISLEKHFDSLPVKKREKERLKYFADELHPTRLGHEFCARKFITEKRFKDLPCPLKD